MRFIFPPIVILTIIRFDCLANVLIDLSNVTLAEFRQTINHHDLILVAFHFTDQIWRAMKRDLVEVVENFQNVSPSIPIARVDCSSSGFEICSEFNIVQDPSLVLMRHGSIDKMFHQSRDSKTLTNWLRQNSRIVSIRIWSYSKLNQLLDEIDDILVVAIFSGLHDDLVDSYHQATLQIIRKSYPRRISFFHVFDQDASGQTSDLTNIGLKPGILLKAPSIVLRRPKWLTTSLEDSSVVYETKSGEDIAGWIARKAYGTIGWMTKENQDDLSPPSIVAYFDFDFIQRAEFSHRWRNNVIRMSRKFPTIKFAVANSLDFRNDLKKLGIKAPRKNDEPVFIATDSFGSKFVMRDEFSEKNMATFIQHYSQGLLAPISLSSNIPAQKTNSKSSMSREIAGNSFHKHVSHSPKDILIRFYEPSCKYSKEFEPYWRELVNQLANEPNLQLISMNGKANTIPSSFEVTQLPTVYMVPSSTKQKIKYTGGRTLHELIQFVAKWSSKELVNFKRDGSRQVNEHKSSSRKVKEEL